MPSPRVATKLHLPKPRPDLVARPRLAARLDRGAKAKLTLVSAPTGFGKTSLVSQWLSSRTSQDRTVVWIALDPTDDQPVAFWAQVLTALQAAALPAIGKSILPLLESGQPPTEGVLAVVVNELSALGRPPLYLRAVGNPPGAHDSAVVNSSAWRTAEIPAVNGHGTARAVAGFYHALSTGRILSAETLAEATRPQCSGTDQVFGDDNAWGLGFGIDDEGFGMGGLGGSYGGTSTRGGYSLGFVTGSAGSHQRVTSLENSLRTCLALEPLDP